MRTRMDKMHSARREQEGDPKINNNAAALSSLRTTLPNINKDNTYRMKNTKDTTGYKGLQG